MVHVSVTPSLCPPSHCPPLPDVNYKQGLDLHQDPHIYTIGTEYLMPGPAGNLYKVPNDPAVRAVLINQARRALNIFNKHNLPRPPPELVVRAPARRAGRESGSL